MVDNQNFVTMQSRGLITIPTAIRRHFGLYKPGIQLEMIEREGEIVLRPHVPIPADQAWYRAERWQKMEREANEAIADGLVTKFDDVEEFLTDLDS